MSAPLKLCVFVQNRVGRKGVPVARSFERWAQAAAAGRRRGFTELNIVLFDTRAARALNKQYRGKDYATNVLSFPYEAMAGDTSPLLGDLVMCPAVISREAREQGKNARDHYAHLTVHGVLHLLGHDHVTERDAAKMEAIERRVLAGLGISDPYELT
jgi:probable rRNA maturation factor